MELNELENKSSRRRLGALRDELMTLHKALIDSERIGYEQAFGAIASPHQFWKLLIEDPWFAWMRPLSGFISRVDEALDGPEPIGSGTANDFFREAIALLTPAEAGEGFGRHYFEALQREPSVIMAHAEVVRLHRAHKS